MNNSNYAALNEIDAMIGAVYVWARCRLHDTASEGEPSNDESAGYALFLAWGQFL
jgi:hypothetical protein